jgi:hypothetical protein
MGLHNWYERLVFMVDTILKYLREEHFLFGLCNFTANSHKFSLALFKICVRAKKREFKFSKKRFFDFRLETAQINANNLLSRGF